MVLIEPSLFALLPQPARAKAIAELAEIIDLCKTEGPEAALRTAITNAAGDTWTKLDAETQTKRLQSLAGILPFVGPHHHSLMTLRVTDEDVTNLRPAALLLYGAKSFWFQPIIASRFRSLRSDLRMITAENAAHNVHRDRADIVNAEVLSFLSE